MAEESNKRLDKVRQFFPEVCKWYTPEAEGHRSKAEIEAEVVDRSKQYQEKGISPCEKCPLCTGEHHS